MALDHPENEQIGEVLFSSSEEAFNEYVDKQLAAFSVKPTHIAVQASSIVDQLINFSSLLGKKFNPPSRSTVHVEKKKRILIQMSGSNDVIFCECRLIANKFNIVLDFRLLNRPQ